MPRRGEIAGTAHLPLRICLSFVVIHYNIYFNSLFIFHYYSTACPSSAEGLMIWRKQNKSLSDGHGERSAPKVYHYVV